MAQASVEVVKKGEDALRGEVSDVGEVHKGAVLQAFLTALLTALLIAAAVVQNRQHLANQLQ